MTIEKYRLGIMNPVTSEKEKYLIFHQSSTELIRDVTVGGGVIERRPPSGAQGRKARKGKNRDEANNSTLLGLVGSS